MEKFTHLTDDLHKIEQLVSTTELDTLEDCIELVENNKKFFVETYETFTLFEADYLKYRDDQGSMNPDAIYPWGYKGAIETIHFLLKEFATGRCGFTGYGIYRDPSKYNWNDMAKDLDYCFNYYNRVKLRQNKATSS